MGQGRGLLHTLAKYFSISRHFWRSKNNLLSKIKVVGSIDNITIDQKNTIHGNVIFDVSHGGKINVGSNCTFMEGVIIASYGGNIHIGNNCSFNPYSVIYGHGDLTIGDSVRIAAHTVIIPANHIFENPNIPIYKQGLTKQGIIIEEDVWLGAGVKVLDGVKIGRGSVIGAGSVVNRSIDSYSICVGIPVRTIGKRK